MRDARQSIWQRSLKRPSTAWLGSACFHLIGVLILTFIVLRLPQNTETFWTDVRMHSELPSDLELQVDSVEVAASDFESKPWQNIEMPLENRPTTDLSFQPTVFISRTGESNDGQEAALPASIAKLVAERGGRVLRKQQQGISATLQWKGRDDLDLHVRFGSEHCYFENMKTGRFELDVDANADSDELVQTPIENVVTRAKSNPNGPLRIGVHHFASRSRDDSREFTLFVVADGKCESFTGTVRHREMKVVCEYARGKPLLSGEQAADEKWLQFNSAVNRKQSQKAKELLADLMNNYSGTAAAKLAQQWAALNGGGRNESESDAR